VTNAKSQIEVAHIKTRQFLDCSRIQSLGPSVQVSLDADVDSRRRSTRLLMRLGKHYKQLPRVLYVKNIVCTNKTDPVFGGGYADIFQGTLEGRTVALKRLRTFTLQPADRDKMHAVNHFSFNKGNMLMILRL
jgi:hypothetical protein